jgi:hypothetical protein
VSVDLSGKRVLLLGAETELGRAIAAALAEAGARLGLVGAANDAEAAFEVKRLARKVGAEVSQAIDATNEMAVRVMVRQASKALGGLDAAVQTLQEVAGDPARAESNLRSAGFFFLFASRELDRTVGSGIRFVVVQPDEKPMGIVDDSERPWRATSLSAVDQATSETGALVVAALAAPVE